MQRGVFPEVKCFNGFSDTLICVVVDIFSDWIGYTFNQVIYLSWLLLHEENS